MHAEAEKAIHYSVIRYSLCQLAFGWFSLAQSHVCILSGWTGLYIERVYLHKVQI